MTTDEKPKRNYFDCLSLQPPQIMIIVVLMLAYFFQQFNNWSFSFLAVAILKSRDLVGQLGNQVMAEVMYWYFIGMTVGGVGAGFISDWLGRRKAILAGIFILSASSVVAGSSSNLNLFIAARAMTGFGIFFLMITSFTYIAEMMPAASRSVWQCRIAAVGFCGAPVSAYLSKITMPMSPDSWRYVLLFGGVGIVAFFLGLTYIKESPRWLVAKNRRAEAEGVILDLTGEQVDLAGANAAAGAGANYGFFRQFAEMFGPRYRTRTFMYLAMYLFTTPAMFLSAFWMPKMFAEVMPPERAVNAMSYISWSIPIGCLVGSFVTDYGGRKLAVAALMVLSGVFAMVMAASTNQNLQFAAGFLEYVVVMAYSFVSFSYTPEVYPTRFRNGVVGIHNGVGRIAVSGFQPLVAALLGGGSVSGVYIAIGVLFFVGVPFVLVWGERTSRRPLEELSD